MLPQNSASIVPVPGVYVPPDDQVTNPLIDFEAGGVALQDPTQGLTGFTWKLFNVNLDIFVQRNNDAPIFMFSQSSLTELSLAFDQNMRANIAYRTSDGVIHLRWYDSVGHVYVTSDFGQARNPRLCLDDKRLEMSNLSDVLLAYIKPDNTLCVRMQRDRYGVEYVIATGLLPNTKLKNIGMNENYRVQMELA